MNPTAPQNKTDAPIIEQDPHSLSLSSELEHVTQEMYKKNAELLLSNKTLSILQKINTVILSSVTDIKQIAQQVVDITTSEAEFKRMSIFMVKKGEGLIRLASSGGEAVSRAEYLVKRKFPSENIPLENKNNLLAKVVDIPRLQITNNYHDVLLPDFTVEEAGLIQETLNVRSILVYPLVVREEVIGVIVMSLGEDADEISEYKQDLMNRLVGIIGVAIDNSLLYQKIQEANERLKELDKLKDEFVSLASHELRTPMTAIKSYVWLLLHGNIDAAKQKAYLERTYTSTERLINLVNDMLNISRIESGRMTVTVAPVDVVKLVDDVLQEVSARAAEFSINLVFERPDKIITARADQDKIKEVLINLIGNSIKFTPQNGTITISEKENNGAVEISVRDNGKGIKPEDIGKLFQKFNMLGGQHLTKERGQGTGLGLYLSKSIVELHGGKIWVESEGEGKGSVFTFTLPLMPIDGEVIIDSNSQASAPAVGSSGAEQPAAVVVVPAGQVVTPVVETQPAANSNTNSPSQEAPRG